MCMSMPPILPWRNTFRCGIDRILDKAIVDEQVSLKLAGEQLPALLEGEAGLRRKIDGKIRTFTARQLAKSISTSPRQPTGPIRCTSRRVPIKPEASRCAC